ncbi:DNA repair protein xp-c / rad4 [Anaeramoeba flamelloides]|uniref:DNA repair protein xp-c / rad4 n=1 Tax=Anaeramoeba flamelloides TaxID=1746091 RepID=A0AAV7YE40_9EUKA|nr:DNA repair protein xp-c / rad4 [Anaeramoeba flamelloides]
MYQPSSFQSELTLPLMADEIIIHPELELSSSFLMTEFVTKNKNTKFDRKLSKQNNYSSPKNCSQNENKIENNPFHNPKDQSYILNARTTVNNSNYPLNTLQKKSSQSSILMDEPLRRISNNNLELQLNIKKMITNEISHEQIEKGIFREIDNFQEVEEQFNFMNKMSNIIHIDESDEEGDYGYNNNEDRNNNKMNIEEEKEEEEKEEEEDFEKEKLFAKDSFGERKEGNKNRKDKENQKGSETANSHNGRNFDNSEENQNYQTLIHSEKNSIIFQPTNSIISLLEIQMNQPLDHKLGSNSGFGSGFGFGSGSNFSFGSFGSFNSFGSFGSYGSYGSYGLYSSFGKSNKANNYENDENDDEATELPQGSLESEELDLLLGLNNENYNKEANTVPKPTIKTQTQRNIIKEYDIYSKTNTNEMDVCSKNQKLNHRQKQTETLIQKKKNQTRNKESNRENTNKKSIVTDKGKMENNEKLTKKQSKQKMKKKRQRKRKFTKSIETSKGNENTLNNFQLDNLEFGKDVFKLIAGQLWVIMGGGTVKVLKPYTNTFCKKLNSIFKGIKLENKSFQKQLKYLLSNSRRTFTEFILEIFIGILSLIFSDSVPDLTIEFWNLLEELCMINIKKNEKINENENENENQNENVNENVNVNVNENENDNDNEDANDKISKKLEGIYEKIYQEHILMHWFNKRFCEHIGQIFPRSDQKIFFNEHLFYFGKSKFLLSCMLLAKDMIKRRNELEKYFHLITETYDNDPLNLYFHNRGNKLKFVKNYISEFGLNNGEYWSIISNDYISRVAFTPGHILKHPIFKNVLSNPKFLQLGTIKKIPSVEKHRNVTKSVNVKQIQIKNDWLFKKNINKDD